MIRTPIIFSILLIALLLVCNFNIVYADIENPVAVIEIDNESIIRESITIQFDGSKSTDNVDIDNWTWEISNETSSVFLYGEIVSYQFNYAGTYEVTLIVTDAEANTGSETITITVRDMYQWWSYILSYLIVFAAFGILYVILFKMFRDVIWDKRNGK